MGERSGRVQTVRGLIEPALLGHTQPHEHLLCNLLPPGLADLPEQPIRLETLGHLRRHWTENPWNLRLDEPDVAIEEMGRYRAAGGGAIVELTSRGIRRDPEGLRRISQESGVHVVMGCGWYEAAYHPPEIESADVPALCEQIVRDVEEGEPGSGIRAGIIGEIGLGWPMKPAEERVLRAACEAQRRTGAALSIHPGRSPEAPMQAMRIALEAGADPGRTVMCHIDRTLFERSAMLELARTGCHLELDLFGQESSFYPIAEIDMPNDATRIDHLMALGDAGYGDRLLISQDICTKLHLTRYGGESYCHILENVIPMMERKGLSKGVIEQICVDNPRRLLTFD